MASMHHCFGNFGVNKFVLTAHYFAVVDDLLIVIETVIEIANGDQEIELIRFNTQTSSQ